MRPPLREHFCFTRSSITACAVGDAGQDIGSGGDAAAVTVSGGVGSEIGLCARLVRVAGEAAAGIEVERVGGGHAVLDEGKVDGLFVLLRRLILFEILVAGSVLGFGAIGR